MLNSAIPTATIMAHIPSMVGDTGMKPTRIIQLLNMVSVEDDLRGDDDYWDLIEDVKEVGPFTYFLSVTFI